MCKRHCSFLWLIIIGLVTVPAMSGSDDGILGIYYDSYYFSGDLAFRRIDPGINFDWGTNPPDPTMRNRQFCVRWLGELEVPSTEAYTFILRADGFATLRIDDRPVIERVWRGGTPTEMEVTTNLGANQTYLIEVEYEASGGGATIQLFWRSPSLARQIIPAGMLRLPLRARTPSPAAGAAEIVQHPTLQWTAGYRAIHHDVYLGDDADAVTNATPATPGIYRDRLTRDQTTFDPGPLEWDTPYFWRIDEVNDAHPESPWKGPLWQFTTADFLLVDDFECYRYEEGEHVWETWIDGLGAGPDVPGNGTGSLVGNYLTHQSPVVYGGRESMRYDYDNANAPYYSEVCRTWNTPQDWTTDGLTHLSLWIKGRPAPLLVKSHDGVVLGIPGTFSDWGGYAALRFGYRQAAGDCEIVAKVEDFKDGESITKAGLMIHETADLNSKYVAVSIAADHGLSFERRLVQSGNILEDKHDALPLPHWIRLTRKGDVFTAQHSVDGMTWEQIVDAQREPVVVNVAMTQTVCVGLYMTSHTGTGNATAEFSSVAITGSISDQWQVTDPEWGNSPESFYVALEDDTGRIGKAVHPTLVNAVDWTQWKIPLSDFAVAGVDFTMVKSMYIGVGDRDNPQPGGEGSIFIDDIRLIKP